MRWMLWKKLSSWILELVKIQISLCICTVGKKLVDIQGSKVAYADREGSDKVCGCEEGSQPLLPSHVTKQVFL